MSKKKSTYVCQECGEAHPRWAGRCDACGAWNSVHEETVTTSNRADAPRGRVTRLAELDATEAQRSPTGIAELDRVLGGGFVPGGTILIGGDPGVGKSTLLLEVATRCAKSNRPPLYVTAEESATQIALRARRLGLDPEGLLVLAEDRVESVLDAMLDEDRGLVIVDSIQTVRKASLGSAAGSVAQVRECAADLVDAARRSQSPLVLVGHVTKDGLLAGPRVLEHLVDAVLYFEGERETEFRVLRAIKNRFGPVGEVAVFAMSEKGLVEPERPAAAFLGASRGLPGAVVAAIAEGSRGFLVEVQALTSPATYGAPRVRTNGIDGARAAMLAAVLTRRCGLELGDQDIHLNVAGGFKVSDPGVDLAICLAMASSFLDRPLASNLAVCGEVGLGGEVRAVRNLTARIREASALGFEKLLAPTANDTPPAAIEVLSIDRVHHLLEFLDGARR
jgi:DNA repair protein RadA/Sms